MTKVTFYKNSEKFFTKIEVSGHTDFDALGQDTLCAALSGIVQAGALGILNVCKVKAEVKSNDKKGFFSLTLPNQMSEEEFLKTNLIFLTILEGVKDLEKGYSKNIKLEVR